jgi:GT2 family glycosyltransferase
MRASVIIPHLNTPELLVRVLQSVVAQRLDHGAFEIIVVDNGSHMPLEAVKAAWPQVRFLLEPQPGPGLARNRGIAAAAASTLVFIDADCRAGPGWLQAAVRAVEGDPARAVVGGRIDIDVRDPAAMTGAEAFETVFAFNQKRYIAQERFSVTANLAMAAGVFAAVGPFAGIDRAEDRDWGRRAAAAGYATRYLQSMRVWHPARPDALAMRRKWQRMIGHDWAAHTAAGLPHWRWHLRAVAVLASIARDLPRQLASPRLRGIDNRLRGASFLFQTRWFRFIDMRNAARPGASSGSLLWNRST